MRCEAVHGRASKPRGQQSRRASRAARQLGQIVKPALDQGDPLSTAPPLHLFLEPKRILDPIELGSPDQADWSSSTDTRVRGPDTEVVFAHPTFEIDGAADVERPVSALEYVGPCHPRLMPVIRVASTARLQPVDKELRLNGVRWLTGFRGSLRSHLNQRVPCRGFRGFEARCARTSTTGRLRLVIEAESFEFHADSDSFGRDVRQGAGPGRAHLPGLNEAPGG